MTYRADKLGDGRTDRQNDGQTDVGIDNTRRPKLASGKKNQLNIVITWIIFLHKILCSLHLNQYWFFIKGFFGITIRVISQKLLKILAWKGGVNE